MSFSVKSSNLFSRKINHQTEDDEKTQTEEDGVEETKSSTPVTQPVVSNSRIPMTLGMAIRINDYSMEDGY
jgi:hypothetical protein